MKSITIMCIYSNILVYNCKPGVGWMALKEMNFVICKKSNIDFFSIPSEYYRNKY